MFSKSSTWDIHILQQSVVNEELWWMRLSVNQSLVAETNKNYVQHISTD